LIFVEEGTGATLHGVDGVDAQPRVGDLYEHVTSAVHSPSRMTQKQTYQVTAIVWSNRPTYVTCKALVRILPRN
jgi:hypothetical protein